MQQDITHYTENELSTEVFNTDLYNMRFDVERLINELDKRYKYTGKQLDVLRVDLEADFAECTETYLSIVKERTE